MKVVNLRKITKPGKIRAFFELETPKLTIRDMKLIENDKGELWAATPSRQYESNGEKKWTDIVRIHDQQLLERITQLAREAYLGPDEVDESDIPF